MCGIAGLFRFDGAPVALETLKRMTDAMLLRGPDGEGFHVDGSFGLAHRRLSIIDLEGGAQPIANEDNTVFIVVNGELYNFQELRKSLEAKGHRFRTHSDSECALHAYEEFGTEFPKHLNGMFAIAIYDSVNKKMILTRDRAGEKPLLYLVDGEQFAFASEIGALKSLHSNFAISPQGVCEYLSLMYNSAASVNGFLKLPPATYLEVGIGKNIPPKIVSYWSPAQKTTVSGFESAASKLRELVMESVKKRLVSDVPLGVFLSGGLDSAIIAAAASQVPASEPLQCFSIGFEDAAYDESAQAKANAEYLSVHAKRKVEFYHKIVKPNEFGVLEMLLSHCGEPYADSSILPTHLLCRFARERVTVALSGDGADELFGGYERYLVMRDLHKLDILPHVFRRLFGGASKLLSGSGGDRTKSARLKRLLYAAALNPRERYLFLISAFSVHEMKKLCRFSLDDFELIRGVSGSFETQPDAPEKFDFYNYLPNDILVKTDRASMASSLEVRAPFLDHGIIEFAMSLPQKYKMNGMRRKCVLAEAFRGFYPPGLELMRKRGFGIPLAAWFRGAWMPHLKTYLLDGKGVNEFGLFHKSVVERYISEHCSGKADHSKKLYTLLAFELAMRS